MSNTLVLDRIESNLTRLRLPRIREILERVLKAAENQDKSPDPTPSRPGEQVMTCPIEQIKPGQWQPRRSFDELSIKSLADSIQEDGILQPLLVREVQGEAEEAKFELIAGERRWRAAQRAGVHQVPVIIKQVDDKQALEISLVENIQRQDLNPIEEAEAYRSLIEQFGYSHEDLSRRIGKDRATVTNTLRLLKLPQDIQEDLIQARINPGHARALLSLDDIRLMRKARNKILKNSLSVRAAESLTAKMARQTKTGQDVRTAEKNELARELKALEDSLTRALGTRVKIKPGKGKQGKIEIIYSNFDELTRIIRLIQDK